MDDVTVLRVSLFMSRKKKKNEREKSKLIIMLACFHDKESTLVNQ